MELLNLVNHSYLDYEMRQEDYLGYYSIQPAQELLLHVFH